MKKVSIIGAGPAGLFCAHKLLQNGFEVNLFDQMSGVGKKFLIAGKSGLNLTHGEKVESFVKKYSKDEEFFTSLIKDFGPNDLRQWCHDLGVETFVGSSLRVFPKEMKAAKLLSNWLKELKAFSSFNLFLNHKFINVDSRKNLKFLCQDENVEFKSDYVVFAMGGASWKKTGSDGNWAKILSNLGISILPFKPMNCGFETNWSEEFVEKVSRGHLKNVKVSCKKISTRSELMITPYGLEGTAIYNLSATIRDEILRNQKATLSIDLRPDLTQQQIEIKLINKRNKDSMANHLRKKLNLDKVSVSLLREFTSKLDWSDLSILSSKVKSLDISLTNIRPIDEAISTGGGVNFDDLSQSLEFKKFPDFYAIGEMLDFEAPTGGYLLQGCFSSAFRVATSIIKKASL